MLRTGVRLHRLKGCWVPRRRLAGGLEASLRRCVLLEVVPMVVPDPRHGGSGRWFERQLSRPRQICRRQGAGDAWCAGAGSDEGAAEGHGGGGRKAGERQGHSGALGTPHSSPPRSFSLPISALPPVCLSAAWLRIDMRAHWQQSHARSHQATDTLAFTRSGGLRWTYNHTAGGACVAAPAPAMGALRPAAAMLRLASF